MRAWGSIVMIMLIIILVFLNINIINEKNNNPKEIEKENPITISNIDQLKIYAEYEPIEIESPYDRISEEQIITYNDKVIINLENPILVSFADTNSMDPLIDKGSNGIEIVPDSEDDIHVGDIISFNPIFSEKPIIHRVINKSQDDLGTYFITKGDNLIVEDPEKVRFTQINRVLVGIIY